MKHVRLDGVAIEQRTCAIGRWPEYGVWRNMKQRCLNKKLREYDYYGGRGITVCQRWLDSFLDFVRDVGVRPQPELSLDRINNDGNYEPGNTRWATVEQQANNQRRPPERCLTLGSETKTVSEWAALSVVRHSSFQGRLSWPLSTALTRLCGNRHQRGGTIEHFRILTTQRRTEWFVELDGGGGRFHSTGASLAEAIGNLVLSQASTMGIETRPKNVKGTR